MFKLILAQTIINGLQTRDYSFYTMPLKKDFILKVLENCLNNPNQDFNVIYRNTVLEQQDQQLEEMGITKQAKRDENGNVIGYLIRIPMTSSYDNAYENRVRFIQTHSYHNWCTHTKKALEYIQGGDFVIYEPNNQSFSNIAFRYYNGEITELVNNKNDGNIEINDIAYYESICNSFPELRPDFSEDILNKYDPAIIEKNIRENITRKPYEEINTYQLFDINECFASDEGRKEVLKQFNIAYLNAFLNRPNLKETISFDDIENLNIIFRNSEDENIQILLDKIKAVYSNSPQAASSLIVPF